MFPLSVADDAKSRGIHDTTGIAVTSPIHPDPMKALVVKYIGQLVAAGQAEWERRENGNVWLRFQTGEIFLLEETTIARVA
jgi:hypothetical protein